MAHWVVAVMAATVSLGAADPRGVVVEVSAGPRERKAAPVVLTLPEGLKRVRDLALEPVDGGRAVAVQVVAGDTPAVAWIVNDLPAGGKRRYRLGPSHAGKAGAAVRCVDDGEGLTLRVGGREVLRYHQAVVEPPAGIDPVYRRSGQIHPLKTPSGLVVSDDFSPDHAHQHGLFFAWVNTTFAGRKVDFWNQKSRTGGVRHVAVLGTADGPVFAQFTVKLRHEAFDPEGKPTPALDEVWTVRAYNVTDRFLVDFESRQTCAGGEPLTLNTYHYGGLGLRGNRAWLDPTARGDDPPDPARSGASDFLTSEGKRRADGNHTRPRWVDLSGRVGDRVGGVAVLDHPSNFRFPQPVRLHPNMPYFAFSPVVLGGFAVEPGRAYVSRYRIDLHDGPPDPAAIDRLYHDYAEPPRASVVEAADGAH